MQDIVYKLVPKLQESENFDLLVDLFLNKSANLDEMERERAFYSSRGLPCPKDVPVAGSEQEAITKAEVDQHAEADYHRQDEQVSNYQL